MSQDPPSSLAELKTLQKVWYKKLKENGFEDIEDTSSPREYLKTWHSSYFQVRYTPEIFDLKQEYYRRASQFLHDHTFVDIIQKKIWELHAEGQSVRAISLALEPLGIQMNKDQVHKVVVGLVKQMKESPEGEGNKIQKKDLILIRAATLSDKNFIYATWLQGLYHGNDWFKEIPQDLYFENYQKVIDRILNRDSVFLTVACLKEDQDVVLGYAVLDRKQNKNILHWVYVKEAWRKIGLAKDLVPLKIDEVTHLTKMGRAVKSAHIQFNPFNV